MRLINLQDLPTITAVKVNDDLGAIGGPIVIPLAVQVVLNWTVAGGRSGHNVLYGKTPAVPAPTVAMAQALFAGMTTGALWTAMATHLASTLTINSVSVMSVHAANQPVFVSTGSAVAGANATLALPAEMALCVTLRTALRGRSNRGRIFIPNYSVDQVGAGSIVVPLAVTDTAAWANNFITLFSGQGMTLSIGQQERAAYTSPITGTAFAHRDAQTVPVTSLVVRDNHWDSQRRRGLK